MKTTAAISKYSLAQRIFHWAMALLLVINIGIGIGFSFLGPARKANWLKLHEFFGTLLLVLLVFRVAAILYRRAPALPRQINKFEQLGIKSTHFAMYLLMICIPLSGILKLQAKGKVFQFFGQVLPQLIKASPQYFNFFSEVHELGSYMLLALIILHTLGILIHHFIKKIPLLGRMTMNVTIKTNWLRATNKPIFK